MKQCSCRLLLLTVAEGIKSALVSILHEAAMHVHAGWINMQSKATTR